MDKETEAQLLIVESEFEPVRFGSVLNYCIQVVGMLWLLTIRHSTKNISKKTAQGSADRFGND